jgi:adenosine deaminase
MTSSSHVPTNANVVNHTHLDCVPRHADIVAMAAKEGFGKFEEPFPSLTVKLASAAELLWQVGGKEYSAMARKLRARATSIYRTDCYQKAEDLTLYCAIIAKQICPLMQTPQNMAFFTRHYIEDLIADHTIGAQIRYAPHLHLAGGMRLEETVESVAQVVSEAPIPIKLILGVLRGPDNEANRKVAREIRELCVRYSQWVGAMDICGAEGLYPGVPDWYFNEAVGAYEDTNGKVLPTGHFAEVAKLPQSEVDRLKRSGVRCVGHFIWNDDPDLYQECCPHSNVLIKAHPDIRRFRDHNINRKLKEGQRVMLSTDGTTLIRTSMLMQMALGRRSFGWTDADLFRLNMNAVDGGYYEEADKKRMRKQLALSYGQ